MHIIVFSQCLYPEDFRINDICRQWVKRGYMVTAVTGIPNYPAGRFYPGYGLFKKRRESWEGVDIIHMPVISRGHNKIRLVLNYASFVVAGFFFAHFTRIKADQVFMFETSPFTQCLVGKWYAKRRKIPCSIYVQDLWPENVISVAGVSNATAIKAIDKMVDGIYNTCDRIYATSPSFVGRLNERGSTHINGESKVRYWPQYAEDFYKPSDSPIDFGTDEPKVIFTGNIGYAQGLDVLPKIAKSLKECGQKVKFVIVGSGRYEKAFVEEIEKTQVQEYFMLTGRKPPQDIPALLAGADAAFLSFADDELWRMTIPAKLQSYMACGMPVFAIAGGETKRVIEEADCGVVCDSRDADKAADALMAMLSDKSRLREQGQNALVYNEKHFDREKLLDEIDRELKSL